jgi:hypothetical protein
VLKPPPSNRLVGFIQRFRQVDLPPSKVGDWPIASNFAEGWPQRGQVQVCTGQSLFLEPLGSPACYPGNTVLDGTPIPHRLFGFLTRQAQEEHGATGRVQATDVEARPGLSVNGR